MATVTGTPGDDTLVGSDSADEIDGGDGGDHLSGLAGDDSLNGGNGQDWLDGGPGADRMAGGADDDRYVVDNVRDIVIEAANQGYDIIETEVSLSLGADASIEMVIALGLARLTLNGNEQDNILVGNAAGNRLVGLGGDDELSGEGGDDQLSGGAGDDQLVGGRGADHMAGGLGNDRYYVDNLQDRVTELPGEGFDTIVSSIDFSLKAYLDIESLASDIDGDLNFSGNERDNWISGGYGNDTISGGEGADILRGQIGDDRLDGGPGADQMFGGYGDDIIIVNDRGDQVIEGSSAGIDEVITSISFDLADSQSVERLTATGTAAVKLAGNAQSNELTGNDAANILTGGRGDDTLNGRGGDDQIDGGRGADLMRGGGGDDRYHIDNRGDQIAEDPDDGDDSAETRVSYVLNDTAALEHLIALGTADIALTGSRFANELVGNTGNNRLAGGGGDDQLGGGAGDDVLDGGTGRDRMVGGTGNDSYFVDKATDQVFEASDGGDDIVFSTVSFALGADQAVEILQAEGTRSLALKGNALANGLIGNRGNNSLAGLAGDDRLDGLDGDDRLDGGTGADVMAGGAGDDRYAVDNAVDMVVEAARRGHDLVVATVDHTLAANVEDLTLGGTADLNGRGNDLDNVITGNKGVNRLEGVGGDDTLIGARGDRLLGGLGDDLYVIASRTATPVEIAGEGRDRVAVAIDYALGDNVEDLTLTGSRTVDGRGNELNNNIIGNEAANTLRGLDGNDRLDGAGGGDRLIGGRGNDIFIVDAATDQVIEVVDEGKDTVEATINWTLGVGQAVEVLRAVGTDAIALQGNEKSNTIYGNAAGNVLKGGAGNDKLIGLDGDDILIGEDGNDLMRGGAGDDEYRIDQVGDRVVENAGEGADTVQSSVSFTLSDNVETLILVGHDFIDGTGSDQDNHLIGNSRTNTLTGLGGNDILEGGDEGDILVGGTGDDTYIDNTLMSLIVEQPGEGTDTVITPLDFHIGNNIENVTLVGSAGVDATGDDRANVIIGNIAVNHLLGGGGDDRIGGGANDVVRGGSGFDRLIAPTIDGDVDPASFGTLEEMEGIDLGGQGTNTAILNRTVVDRFADRIIWITGDDEDHVVTTDGGWISGGTIVDGGVAYARYEKDGRVLMVDPGIDRSGIRGPLMFGPVEHLGGRKQVIHIDALDASRGIEFRGTHTFDNVGYAMDSAGDVNGDGFTDIIIGAKGAGRTVGEGEAYVIFGRSSEPPGGADRLPILGNDALTPDLGFVIRGKGASDNAGARVAGGDVNGDGFDDLVLLASSRYANYRGDDAFIIFGSAGGFGTLDDGRAVVDLADLPARAGVIIDSGFNGPFDVAVAGDINGDGLDDMIFGPIGDLVPGQPRLIYVVFGSRSGFGSADGLGHAVIDLKTLQDSDGFAVRTASTDVFLLDGILPAGDLNGDGIQDLVIPIAFEVAQLPTAAYASDGIYVLLGSDDGFGTATTVNGTTHNIVDLAKLPKADGFVIEAAGLENALFRTVSSLGDFNGDGFDDLIIGVPTVSDSQSDILKGGVSIVFGSGNGFGHDVEIDGYTRRVIDLDNLSPEEGFNLLGTESLDQLGTTVAGAGDVNGDGLDDAIMTFPGTGDQRDYGGVFILFGSTTPPGENGLLTMKQLTPEQGVLITGGDLAFSISAWPSAGDINGDGFDDILLSNADAFGIDIPDGGNVAGVAYIIYGGPAGLDLPQVVGTAGDDDLIGTAAPERLIGGIGNDMMTGNGAGDVFLGGAGDDRIDIGVGDFFRIDGGTGTDTLTTRGDIDFSELVGNEIRNVEIVDVTGNGRQIVGFDLASILAFGAANTDPLGPLHPGVLVLNGDSEDVLDLDMAGLALTSEHPTAFGTTYDLYRVIGNSVVALAVDADITMA